MDALRKISILASSLIASSGVMAQGAYDSAISIQQKNVAIPGAQGALASFPMALCQLRNLESLTLQNHTFTEMPECLALATKTLRVLRLSDNAINKIAPASLQLKFLEILDLSGNKISTKASDDWSGMSKIRQIDLSKNVTLTELPESIGQLTTLETLTVANTQITTLPESFAGLTWLRTLDLRNTKISVTPKALASMVNLEKLMITGAPLAPGELNVIKAIFKDRPTTIE